MTNRIYGMKNMQFRRTQLMKRMREHRLSIRAAARFIGTTPAKIQALLITTRPVQAGLVNKIARAFYDEPEDYMEECHV